MQGRIVILQICEKFINVIQLFTEILIVSLQSFIILAQLIP